MTIGLNFFDGNTWLDRTVEYEINPNTCKNASNSEKRDIEIKCPDLRLNTVLTRTETSSSETTTTTKTTTTTTTTEVAAAATRTTTTQEIAGEFVIF